MNMNETILVTGATGTVGSEVVKQLSRVALNYIIKAGIHSIENAQKVQQYDRVKPIQIDYDKLKGLETAFKGVDKLLLLTHPSPKTAEQESNLITEAAGIKHIVEQPNRKTQQSDLEVRLYTGTSTMWHLLLKSYWLGVRRNTNLSLIEEQT